MKYGRISVDRHRAHLADTGETLHVFLDGEDVTRACFVADDESGYVGRFMRDESGHVRALRHGGQMYPAQFYTRGEVVIRPGEAFV